MSFVPYSAEDYVKGVPLPESLSEAPFRFSHVDLQDVGVVQCLPPASDPPPLDDDAKERVDLGLPLSFGTSKKGRRSRKRRQSEAVDDASPGATHAAVRKALGHRRLVKYWLQRYSLFSKFDQGVELDAEGWYSVTPERIAEHHANKLRSDGPIVVADGCCGVGGNAIQLATAGHAVIAIDRDAERLELAQRNAAVYGMRERIMFVCADVFEVVKEMRLDVLFLSPPWGGPQYVYVDYMSFDEDTELRRFLEKTLRLLDGCDDIRRVVLFLPRNLDLSTLIRLPGFRFDQIEIEAVSLNRFVKGVTVYLRRTDVK